MASTAPMKRPSPDDRRAAILEAAGQVFFEQGYAATSIDAIIERAGGSKRNIYSEFGSKEGLFTALVSESADRSEEHTSELQSLMRISYAVFCLKKKKSDTYQQRKRTT